MKIRDIIRENIFTTDYHQVMDAVAKLYQDHYDINIWEYADYHDEAAKCLMKEHPSLDELAYIIDRGELPERFVDLDFPLNDELMYGISSAQASDLDEAHGPWGKKTAQDVERIEKAKQREKRYEPGQLTRRPMTPGKARGIEKRDQWMAKTYGEDRDLGEEPASRALCTSGKPDKALGASQLASCKSQGYRSREGAKSHKVGSERIRMRGKKIKGKKYGGPLPDWS